MQIGFFLSLYRTAPWLCHCVERLLVRMQRLNQFERVAWFEFFVPGSIFAGCEVCFKPGIEEWKAPSNRGGQFRRAHRGGTQTAQMEAMPSETLKSNRYGSRRGSGTAIEGAKRVKKFDWSGAWRLGQVAHRPAPATEAEHDQQTQNQEADEEQIARRSGCVTPLGPHIAMERLVPIEMTALLGTERV